MIINLHVECYFEFYLLITSLDKYINRRIRVPTLLILRCRSRMTKPCWITNILQRDDKSRPGADEHHAHSSERAYSLCPSNMV
jgi:hypothetical protein